MPKRKARPSAEAEGAGAGQDSARLGFVAGRLTGEGNNDLSTGGLVQAAACLDKAWSSLLPGLQQDFDDDDPEGWVEQLFGTERLGQTSPPTFHASLVGASPAMQRQAHNQRNVSDNNGLSTRSGGAGGTSSTADLSAPLNAPQVAPHLAHLSDARAATANGEGNSSNSSAPSQAVPQHQTMAGTNQIAARASCSGHARPSPSQEPLQPQPLSQRSQEMGMPSDAACAGSADQLGLPSLGNGYMTTGSTANGYAPDGCMPYACLSDAFMPNASAPSPWSASSSSELAKRRGTWFVSGGPEHVTGTAQHADIMSTEGAKAGAQSSQHLGNVPTLQHAGYQPTGSNEGVPSLAPRATSLMRGHTDSKHVGSASSVPFSSNGINTMEPRAYVQEYTHHPTHAQNKQHPAAYHPCSSNVSLGTAQNQLQGAPPNGVLC